MRIELEHVSKSYPELKACRSMTSVSRYPKEKSASSLGRQGVGKRPSCG